MSKDPTAYQPGDSVRLVFTDDEHTSLKPGTAGTVTSTDAGPYGERIVRVDWADGSQLGMLVDNGDKIELLVSEGYTEAELHAAFKLIPKHPEYGWKGSISATVPKGSDTRAMAAALAFFCGSWSEFTEQEDGSFKVVAPGYYMSVGS